MSADMHPLLLRQLRKHLSEPQEIPNDLMSLLNAVSESYHHHDEDIKLIDRAMEISSAELWENNAVLQHKNEMLDAFVYRVSHDLKVPVNNILSLMLMLQEFQTPEMAANPMLQKILANIAITAERMGERIGGLLDLSRLERALDAEDENVDLSAIIELVLKDLDVEIQKSNASITQNFQAFAHVIAGRENMLSMLSNLLSNAIKYRSPDRAPIIHLETSFTPEGPMLLIRDNGIGIDLSKYEAKLFGMFNRFHTHVDGTGVGLFIVKKIVEKAGGKVEVDSTVGSGTTFRIYFKYASAEKKA